MPIREASILDDTDIFDAVYDTAKCYYAIK